MSGYTEYLENKEYEISPEDENYVDELIEVARSFRTFDVVLDDFLLQKGFNGDIADVDSKIRYIKNKFDEAGIPLDLRNPKKWFYNHTRGTNREIAFQFCFAFKLTLSETQDFFRRVYLQRGIDCHDVKEAIYYYCLSHQLTYSEAQSLIEEAPDNKKGSVDFNGEVLFTGSIIQEIDRFNTTAELLSFLKENSEQFGYNNATAYKNIQRIWDKVTGEKGLANQEAILLFPANFSSAKQRSVWDIYLQIFGLLDYDRVDNSRNFLINSDRTLQPLLKSNKLLHPIARESFPDRQGLEGIIKGTHQSNEVVRKTIILLAFYRFWAEQSVKNKIADYLSKPSDSQRCRDVIDRLLVEVGYPTLYEGNPYDWIFMFASQDDYPLETFRDFMREVYLNKEENVF